MPAFIDKFIEVANHKDEALFLNSPSEIAKSIIQNDYLNMIPNLNSFRTPNDEGHAYIESPASLSHHIYFSYNNEDTLLPRKLFIQHNGSLYSAKVKMSCSMNWVLSDTGAAYQFFNKHENQIIDVMNTFMFSINKPDNIMFEGKLTSSQFFEPYNSRANNSNAYYADNNKNLYVISHIGNAHYKIIKCFDLKLELEDVKDVSKDEDVNYILNSQWAYSCVPSSNQMYSLKYDQNNMKYSFLSNKMTNCTFDCSQLKHLTSSLIKQNVPYTRMTSTRFNEFSDEEEIVFFCSPIIVCNRNPRFDSQWNIHIVSQRN